VRTSAPAQKENVCSRTVRQDLCIGCGVCAGLCPTGHLVMDWTPEGLLQPTERTRCLPKCVRCLAVCPFLEQTEDEDTLALSRFAQLPGVAHTPETGYYLSAYVGHAEGYRERGASGGMASWFLAALLENGAVDRVICVRPHPNPARLFAYAVTASPEEVKAGAKSAYYPVELSEAVRTMLREDQRYAVIGLPCVLKALRLAMLADRRLRARVVVLAGLVCGQTKSRVFAEYLSRSQGVAPRQVRAFSFREKDASRPASSFQAQITSVDTTYRLPWAGLYSQTWLSGEFTPRACRFCDDVFAEVADVAFMDAWLPRYEQESRGTSIVLVRSPQAQALLRDGLSQSKVFLRPIAMEEVIGSQEGVVEQKRTQLAQRLWLAGKEGASLRKRVVPARPAWLRQQLLVAKEDLRAASHAAARAADGAGGDWMEVYQAQTRQHRRRLQLLQAAVYWQGEAFGVSRALLRRLKSLVCLRRSRQP
jgi:coenzyme F420 hydrogenase subunit beta